ncbi:MAG: pilus assembly PilX family protein [Rhodanobacter sp.]
MLLILTIASLVIVEQISSQTRMAGNAAAAQQSLQVAEATLSTAMANLLTGAYTEAQFRANAGGLYFYRPSNYSKTAPPPWNTTAGWATAINLPTPFGASDTTTERKYIIEEMPPVRSPGGSTQKAYRITARVVGVGGQGSVKLQTLYKL